MTTNIRPEAVPEPVRYGSPELRHRVEDFLAYDAELLDQWRLEEWLELFTPDCRYQVPATDLPDGDPDLDLFLIRDDYFLLSQRISAMLDGTAWAESPQSTTHRMISNVRVAEDGDGVITVHANFLIHRSRRGQLDSYPGRYEMHLVRGGRAGFEITYRRSVLSLEELRPHGRVSIIL